MEFNLPVPILFVLLIIILIYWKWDEARNWEAVYEAPGMQMAKAQGRFAYLKQRGVKCRMKTITPVGMSARVSPVMATSVRVEVHKKDLQKAYALLGQYRE